MKSEIWIFGLRENIDGQDFISKMIVFLIHYHNLSIYQAFRFFAPAPSLSVTGVALLSVGPVTTA